ncbi:DUF1007 family protein [Roseovarius sp. S4756]|uniref:DUF1007 family protein n=1 Tax=Roseovarius maritimus TaxID=3342637 RepID=UPI003B670130
MRKLGARRAGAGRSAPRMIGALALMGAFAMPAGQGEAHPHVFIDGALSLIFDDHGRLAALRIGWSYDEFYSLVMIEDKGLDADGDGTPEPAQLEAFAGHDVDWAAGFPGDVTLMRDGVAVALEGPAQHRAYFENGRIITTHLRPLSAPVDLGEGSAVAQLYDPSFFVAYDVPALPTIEGPEDCAVTRQAADTDKAYAEYGDKLASVDVGEDPYVEVDLGDIGVLFADRFIVTCAAPS